MPRSNEGYAPSTSTAISELRTLQVGASTLISSERQLEKFSSQPHRHKTEFQLVYVLKGWIEFEYEGQGVVRLEAGSCVHQPPNIRHRELGHSPDIEMLEVVLPAGFPTEEVPSVQG